MQTVMRSDAPSTSATSSVAIRLLAIGAALLYCAPAAPQDRDTVPRIILTDDMGTITNWATPPSRQDIEAWVAGYSRQGIDIVSWDLVGGQLASYKSKVLEPFPETLGLS